MKIKNHNELREYVVDKFGNLPRFADASGMEHSVVKGFMYRSDDKVSGDELKQITAMYTLAENIQVKPYSKELTEDELEAIGVAFKKVYGTPKEFSLIGNWSQSGITDLLYGRRKRKNVRVVELITNLVPLFRVKAVTEIDKNALSILEKSIN